MEISVNGFGSAYEPEQLTRVFFPKVNVRKGRSTRGSVVYVRRGTRRTAVGVRTQSGVCVVRQVQGISEGDERDKKRRICKALYDVLCEVSAVRPPWGILTGVRPLNLLRRQMSEGGIQQAQHFFLNECDVSPERFELACRVERIQRPVLASSAKNSYSLYVSIPFCPTRCAYCSFVSHTTARQGHLVGEYLQKLNEELRHTAQLAEELGLKLASIYVGGGTPTAINAFELQSLLRSIAENFDTQSVEEYTVEAGRADCTTPEKLALLKEYGVGRISVNPQTLQDDVLKAIGRAHTAKEAIECFNNARSAGHNIINTDLIAGLPSDTVEGFSDTVERVLSLAPENITLHTLTLKRASDLAGAWEREAMIPAQMLKYAYKRFEDSGYIPYYMYRQKNTVGSLENTGWTLPGFEGLYNIYIMEEVHSILACGAGACTKTVCGEPVKIKRSYNPKYPLEYIQSFSEVLKRKTEVSASYVGYLDT